MKWIFLFILSFIITSCGTSKYYEVSKEKLNKYFESNNKKDKIEGIWFGYYSSVEKGGKFSESNTFKNFPNIKFAIIKNENDSNKFILVPTEEVDYIYKFGNQKPENLHTSFFKNRIIAEIIKSDNNYFAIFENENKFPIFFNEGLTIEKGLILTTEEETENSKDDESAKAINNLIQSVKEHEQNDRYIYHFTLTKEYPTYYSKTALFEIVNNMNLDLTKRKKDISLIIEAGIDVNSKDNNGMCLIHYAIKNCDYEISKLLIENKADVNSRTDRFLATPLMFISDNKDTCNSKRLIDLLMNSGADINAKQVNGYTTLMFLYTQRTQDALLSFNENNKQIIKNKESVIEKYLLTKGAETKGYDSLFALNIQKWNELEEKERIRLEEEKIKRENEEKEKIARQKEIEKRRKSLTKTEREKIILQISDLKNEIRNLKDKKDLFSKECNKYNDLANIVEKKRQYDLRDDYKKKAQNSGGSAIAAGIAVVLKEKELNDLYDIIPELKP